MKTDEMQLARAYVRIQPYSKPLSPQEGLAKGTIFADLYSPYNSAGKQQRETGITRTYRGGNGH
ncbi:MAG: spore coat associated protein CotJA [Methylocystaceae bacterium]